MNQKAWRSGIILGLGLLGLACTGSDIDAPLEASETTQAVTSTSKATTITVEETTTTLSEAAQKEQAARAEIEDVITKWANYPYDTSKGDEGIPLQYTTGILQQREKELAERRIADGQIQRALGTNEVAVLSIDLDIENGTAEAQICSLTRHELVDAQTEELIQADNSPPFIDDLVLQITPDGWRVSDLFTSGANGDPEACDIPNYSNN